MKKLNFYIALMFFAPLFVHSQVLAEEIVLKYPELQVSPRASKRLYIEAKKESNNTPNFSVHAPALTSSIMTLASAYYLSNNTPDFDDLRKVDEAKKVANAGVLIGAAWVGVISYMAHNYKPYQQGYREVKKMSKKTKADNLALERIAEEKLKEAVETGKKINFLSTLSNFTVSAVMVGYGKGDTALFAGLSALISFAPYYFNNYWKTVNDRHQEYKKKIYGPVSMPYFDLDKNGQLISGVQLSLQF